MKLSLDDPPADSVNPNSRRQAAFRQRYANAHPERPSYNAKFKDSSQRQFLAIDGEGIDDADVSTGIFGKRTYQYHHQRYTLMVASNASGQRQSSIANWSGELGTEQIFRWLMSLPKGSILVGYALGYDYTKMLKDVDRDILQKLYHPDIPNGRRSPPMLWWKGWGLRWLNNRLDIVRGKDRQTIWDVFRFFQTKYTVALKAWCPEAADELAFIETMKGERSNLAARSTDDVTRYALTECRYLALMMTRLRQACQDADIPLTSYYGAGSLAGGLIQRHGTAAYRTNRRQPNLPQPLKDAIESAFSGGRFETAVHGPVHETIHETDVSSAYPSAYRGLPCLKCGEWRNNFSWGDDRFTNPYKLIRVSWSVPLGRWGPFPMRTPTLAYPLNGEAWIWSQELQAARRAFPTGSFTEIDCWSYHIECNHNPHDWVEERFAQRLAWSKEQRGIVLKLGLNAIYGKYAQRVGGKNGPYTSLIWAGLITSYVRARLLDALATPNGDSIIAFATDGILSLKDLGIGSSQKTLGGWESKETMEGAFFIANGLVVPYDGSRIRSRGYESTVVAQALPKLETEWAKDGINARIQFHKRRFIAILTALECTDPTLYGEWIDEVVTQSLDPGPQRINVSVREGIAYSQPLTGLDNTAVHFLFGENEQCESGAPNHRDRKRIERYLAGMNTNPLPDRLKAFLPNERV